MRGGVVQTGQDWERTVWIQDAPAFGYCTDGASANRTEKRAEGRIRARRRTHLPNHDTAVCREDTKRGQRRLSGQW